MRSVFCLLALCALLSCGNDQTDEGTPPMPVNLDNVDGNIPDTTRSGVLNTPNAVDSISGVDTLQRQP